MSATAKAHGMDGTLVEPDWPPLTLAEVRALLAHFPALGEPIEILSISPRPLSAAGVVSTASGRVFIKRHHRTVRDAEGSARGASLSCASASLTAHRFRASSRPRPARQRSKSANGPTKCTKHRPAWISTKTPSRGRPSALRPTRTPRARRWRGCILPRMDSTRRPASRDRSWPASQSLPRRIRASHSNTIWPRARAGLECRSAGQLQASAPTARALSRAASAAPARLAAALDAQRSARLQSLLERLSDNAQATAIIDFGLADRTNAVHDLANAIERNIVEWLVLVADPSASRRCARPSRPSARAARRLRVHPSALCGRGRRPRAYDRPLPRRVRAL